MNKIKLTIAIIVITGLLLVSIPVVTAYQVRIGPSGVVKGSATAWWIGAHLGGQISSTAPVRVTIHINGEPIYDMVNAQHHFDRCLDKAGTVQATVTNPQNYEAIVYYYSLTVASHYIVLS